MNDENYLRTCFDNNNGYTCLNTFLESTSGIVTICYCSYFDHIMTEFNPTHIIMFTKKRETSWKVRKCKQLTNLKTQFHRSMVTEVQIICQTIILQMEKDNAC